MYHDLLRRGRGRRSSDSESCSAAPINAPYAESCGYHTCLRLCYAANLLSLNSRTAGPVELSEGQVDGAGSPFGIG